jgi:hypothetical protein
MSKLVSIFIGVMLFSMIIIGFTTYIGGFRQFYNVTVEEGWEARYDLRNDTAIAAMNISEVLEGEHTNWAEGGYRIGYAAVRVILRIPLMFMDILAGISTRLGLPDWVDAYLAILLVVTIFFVLIQALVRWYL